MEALVGLVIGGIGKLAAIALEAAQAAAENREAIRARLLESLTELHGAITNLKFEETDKSTDAALAAKFHGQDS